MENQEMTTGSQKCACCGQWINTVSYWVNCENLYSNQFNDENTVKNASAIVCEKCYERFIYI